MAKKGVDVGVQITGSAKGFKAASEDAKKATDDLKRNAIRNSREIERQFKMVSIAVAKIGAAALIAQKGFQLFNTIMQKSQLTGDALDITLAGLKETANTVAQNLANADFSVSLRDAKKAAEEYQAVLDDLGDRQRSIDIISAKNNAEIAKLRGQLRDTKLSEEKRLEITAKIQKIGEEELADRKAIAEEALNGIIDKTKLKYKIDLESAKLITEYVETYKLYTKGQQEALSIAQTAQKAYDNNERRYKSGLIDLQTYELEQASRMSDLKIKTAAVIPELQKYISIWRPINDLTDDQRTVIHDIIVGWYNANAAIETYLATADRYEHKLTGNKQINISKVTVPGIRPFNEPIPTLPGIQQSNMKVNIDATTESVKNQIDYVGKLQSTFETMFTNVGGGFKGMVKALIDSIKMLVAELVAKAAVFTVLRFLFPEAAIGMELFKVGAFKKFIGLADGGIVSKPTMAMLGEGKEPEVVTPLSKLQSITGKNQRIKIELTGKFTGRDIYFSAVKYAELLDNNT